MSDPEPGGAEVAVDLGVRVARARSAAGVTLATVAQRSGLSSAFISQIESGTANPTVATLAKVAAALDRGIGQLFVNLGDRPAEAVFAPRVAAVPTAILGSDETGVWDLTAEGSSRLTARLVRGGGSDHFAPVRHLGEELLCVLAGTCRLTVGGLVRDLGPYDACHFPASEVHQVTDGSADLLLVVVVTEA